MAMLLVAGRPPVRLLDCFERERLCYNYKEIYLVSVYVFSK